MGLESVKKREVVAIYRRLQSTIFNNSEISSITIAPNVGVTPAISQAVAPNDVPNSRGTRTAAINASGAGIVAVYKLAALLAVVRQVGTSVSPVSVRPVAVALNLI
ncbi:MAG: hypothetical protein ABJB61_09995 [bacterium]